MDGDRIRDSAYFIPGPAQSRGRVLQWRRGPEVPPCTPVRRDGISDVELDLKLHGPAWAEDLWQHGFYPLAAPYVQERNERRFIVFPPFFSLITAPFYRWFGFRGLYLVPLVSVWLVWVIFLRLVRQLRAPPLLAFLGIFALIWTTPLTLYGALYWEHALVVLLVLAGTAVIASPAAEDHSGRLALAGVLIGLAGWFRPEVVLLGALLGVSFLVLPGRRRRAGVLRSAPGSWYPYFLSPSSTGASPERSWASTVPTPR